MLCARPTLLLLLPLVFQAVPEPRRERQHGGRCAAQRDGRLLSDSLQARRHRPMQPETAQQLQGPLQQSSPHTNVKSSPHTNVKGNPARTRSKLGRRRQQLAGPQAAEREQAGVALPHRQAAVAVRAVQHVDAAISQQLPGSCNSGPGWMARCSRPELRRAFLHLPALTSIDARIGALRLQPLLPHPANLHAHSSPASPPGGHGWRALEWRRRAAHTPGQKL